MADQTATSEHIFRLSSLDQSLVRNYIRCALCFRHTDTDIDTTTSRLTSAVKRIVTHLPILAGTLRPATAEDGNQRGQVEVAVTLYNVTNYKPIIKQLSAEEFPYTYEDLLKARMPPTLLNYGKLASLSESPGATTAAVFGLEANFVNGGLIVVISLHHSVADIVGIKTIINHLSSDLPTRKLTCQELKDEAMDQSRLRDRLSGSRGVRPVTVTGTRAEDDDDITSAEALFGALEMSRNRSISCVLFFNLSLVQETTSLLNNRFHYIHNDRSVVLTPFDTVAAILWKGITRARSNTRQGTSEHTSAAFLPIDMRKKIEPPLDDSYFGNATVHGFATSGTVRLSLPFEIVSLAHAARLIRTTTTMTSEQRVRAIIATVNEAQNVQSAPTTKFNIDSDLVIESWNDLLLEEADLGLGIGQPGWVRKLSESSGIAQGVVYPEKKEDGLWEVMVELERQTIDSLLEDEVFRSYIMHVA